MQAQVSLTTFPTPPWFLNMPKEDKFVPPWLIMAGHTVKGPLWQRESTWKSHKTFTWFKRQAMCVGLFQMVEEVRRPYVVCSVSKGAETWIPPLICHTSALLKVLIINFFKLHMPKDRYQHILLMVEHVTKLVMAVLTHSRTTNIAAQMVWEHSCFLLTVHEIYIETRDPVLKARSSNNGATL